MRLAIGILLATALLGCATSQPIANVTNAPIIVPGGKKVSMREVANAIERAGKSLGWQLNAEGPGLFSGRLALRSHLAVVEIEHDTESYSLRYRDSTNLDAKDGQIHEAYNQWIDKLDKAMRLQLQSLLLAPDMYRPTRRPGCSGAIFQPTEAPARTILRLTASSTGTAPT